MFYNVLYKDLLAEGEVLENVPGNVLKKIRSAQMVIIYGAGKVGRDLLKILANYGVDKVCFAVTHRASSEEYVMGNRVYQIEELVEYKSAALVVIACSR